MFTKSIVKAKCSLYLKKAFLSGRIQGWPQQSTAQGFTIFLLQNSTGRILFLSYVPCAKGYESKPCLSPMNQQTSLKMLKSKTVPSLTLLLFYQHPGHCLTLKHEHNLSLQKGQLIGEDFYWAALPPPKKHTHTSWVLTCWPWVSWGLSASLMDFCRTRANLLPHKNSRNDTPSDGVLGFCLGLGSFWRGESTA